MSVRAVLRSPGGDTVVRDIVGSRWAEPSTNPSSTVGEGLWALPGLVDAHSHLAADALFVSGTFSDAIDRARGALRAGVTLLLDKGWSDDTAVRLIAEVPEAERPDIEAAARIIANPGGYFPDFAIEVTSDRFDEAMSVQLEAGAGWVKLIGDWPRRGVGPVANFDESELKSAVASANAAGSKVAIHTMAPEVPSMAVAAGVHSIEHGLFLTEDDLGPLADRQGMWVPTVLRCEETLAQLGEDSTGGKLFREGLRRVASLLPLAAEAGVAVLAGTDLVGTPADVAAEAVRLGDYGLSNAQVVDAVSTSAFRATGRTDFFEVGSPANAVFFEVNPVEDLGTLGHPRMVIRLGRVL